MQRLLKVRGCKVARISTCNTESLACSAGSSQTAPSRRLLLVGGGHAHLAVLSAWIRRPPSNVETWLITPHSHTTYSGMIPGWMAGHYSAREALIDLRPLSRQAGIRLVADMVCGLDADRQKLLLRSGRTVAYDLLSLGTGGEIDTSHLAALGDRLLPARPMDGFMARWPGITADAARLSSYRLVIVGGGAAGVELALGAQYALQRLAPQAIVSLVANEDGLVIGQAPLFRTKVLAALANSRINVLFGHAVGDENGLLLPDGSRVAADCVIAATGSIAPSWLKTSGITLDPEGFIAVGADLRSVSHGKVFAAGDIINRVDRSVARSGVHAVKAGPVLAANLRASLENRPLQRYLPRKRTLYLLATGDRRAILSWGSFSMSGKLLWRLKDWIDRQFVTRYARGERERE